MRVLVETQRLLKSGCRFTTVWFLNNPINKKKSKNLMSIFDMTIETNHSALIRAMRCT